MNNVQIPQSQVPFLNPDGTVQRNWYYFLFQFLNNSDLTLGEFESLIEAATRSPNFALVVQSLSDLATLSQAQRTERSAIAGLLQRMSELAAYSMAATRPAPASSAGNLSGTYTPVLTTDGSTVITVGNMATAGWGSLPTVATPWTWSRLGNSVLLSGNMGGASSTSTNTFIYFSLPIYTRSSSGNGWGYKTDTSGLVPLSIFMLNPNGFAQQVAADGYASTNWSINFLYPVQ